MRNYDKHLENLAIQLDDNRREVMKLIDQIEAAYADYTPGLYGRTEEEIARFLFILEPLRSERDALIEKSSGIEAKIDARIAELG